MIQMSELMQDPVYAAYLDSTPDQPAHSKDDQVMPSPPWVVYVQREPDGKWGKKEFWRYKPALKFMKFALSRGVHDAALNNRRLGFDPPYRFARIRGKYVVGSDGIRRQAKKRVWWKPRTELLMDQPEHHWCRYCRRPTIFKHYSKHRVIGACDPNVPRCNICGASARIALNYWDSRFRVH